MKYLIAGLGNIGDKYENTRHNIGFMVLDHLAKEFNLSFTQDRHVFKATLKHKGRTFILIKPTTYMNLSGKAIRHWMQAEKITPEHLLVITDDLALPFGTLRMKGKGSAGGHNGLANIEQLIQTTQYPRLRFGVSAEFSKGQQVDYVLAPFEASEQEKLSVLISASAEMVLSFGTIGIERTMNFFNKNY